MVPNPAGGQGFIIDHIKNGQSHLGSSYIFNRIEAKAQLLYAERRNNF